MQSGSQLGDGQARGKREIHELTTAAFAALERAEFAEIFDRLHATVFARTPAELLDVSLVDGVWEWRLKPMAELLLRHIIDTATRSDRTAEERQREILWAVAMAGF